jgi:hypothetical protein
MGEISPIWGDLGRCGEISQNLRRSPAEGREAGDLRRCGVEVGVGSRKGVVEHKEGRPSASSEIDYHQDTF